MAARSTLTVVSGNTITSAWGNSVRDHVVPHTGASDVTTEGQLSADTATDRIMAHDGVSGAVRLAHYRAAGRTGCSYVDTAIGGISNAATIQLSWGGSGPADVDADGMYTGWNGSNYAFTIPAGLGGIWAVSVHLDFNATWTAVTTDFLRIGNSWGAMDFPQQPQYFGNFSATAMMPLDAGGVFWVALAQHSGGVRVIDVAKLTAVRLCI